MMTYESTLDARDCLVAHSQGGMAAALFALGRNNIAIQNSQFYDNESKSAGTITIVGALSVNITDTEFQLNRGGPDIQVINTNLTV